MLKMTLLAGLGPVMISARGCSRVPTKGRRHGTLEPCRIYYVKLTAPDGTLIRLSTETSDRKKAQEYHDRKKAELWDLARLKQKPKRTGDEAALRWLKEKAHKKSYRNDVSRIRWFTGHLHGKTMDKVSRDMIDGILSRYLPKACDRTKDLYVVLIRAIFRKAQREWEWLEQIPAFKTYKRGGMVRVRYLTQAQANILLDRLPAISARLFCSP